MSDEYIAMNYPDRLVCSEFSNQVIKEELIQEEFKCKTYKEDLEIDHEKMDELIENVDININVNNFQNYSECPIVTLNIQNTKIWPCLYIKKFKIYGVVFPNIDFEKYKSIRAKLEKEFETEKTEKNNLDNIIIKNKCDISDFENIENSNKKELENLNNINEDDIIISSNNTTLLENKINLDFPSSNQCVYNTKPNEKIDIEINKNNKIFDEKQKNKKEIENNNKVKEKDILSSQKEEEKLFKLKKLYEEQDVSIVGSITLIENLLNYIIASKSYEENKIHTLISNMVPFGNIIETNINFMLESLNFLNQRLFNSNNLFSQSEKKNQSDQEKIKIPGWVTKIPTTYSENLNITIKEELKYVKYGQNKFYNIILCDISCLAELSRNCEITLPIKETKTNFLGNLRIHPCAKLENQNILNDATRIIFIPPHDEFKMGVFEIENFEHDKLPIIANFCLKESAQNEVKLYLKVQIDENVISKFEYFYINIPLGHFGKIVDTKIMVQVGEVSLVNNKTTLHWDLQNKVFDKYIVLSGTVNYYPRAKENVNREEKKEKNTEKVIFFLKFYFLFFILKNRKIIQIIKMITNIMKINHMMRNQREIMWIVLVKSM